VAEGGEDPGQHGRAPSQGDAQRVQEGAVLLLQGQKRGARCQDGRRWSCTGFARPAQGRRRCCCRGVQGRRC